MRDHYERPHTHYASMNTRVILVLLHVAISLYLTSRRAAACDIGDTKFVVEVLTFPSRVRTIEHRFSSTALPSDRRPSLSGAGRDSAVPFLHPFTSLSPYPPAHPHIF